MILAAPTAPAGSVRTLHQYDVGDFVQTDAILCRNFAPLVRLAFQLIRRGVPCRVLGSEFATQLENLVQSANARDIRDLQSWLTTTRDKEFALAERKKKLRLCQIIEERFDCLIYLASQEQSVSSLMYTLRNLFNDKASDMLTLSTIHKSKGLEYPRVFILDVNLMPSKYATQPWEIQQETNLRYVAVTRAKLDLIYIRSECWPDSVKEDEAD